jgi:hypothetical protein
MRTGLMSSRNSPTLTLDVRPRRAEKSAAGLVLVGGASSVAILDPLCGAVTFAAIACLVTVGYGLWRSGWIGSRHRIITVRWQADGRWLLDDREHTVLAELASGSRLFGTALWLRWKTPGRRWRSMLLTGRDLPPDQLRALAVRLRIDALERELPEAGAR